MRDLSFNNILYDNSLEKPKFVVSGERVKERYPGISSLLQKLKEQYSEISIIGNRFIFEDKLYTVRYNSKGQWAFGDVDDKVDIIFAISKDSEKKDEFTMVNVEQKDMFVKSGSWSLAEDKRKDLISQRGNMDTINDKIIKCIGGI